MTDTTTIAAKYHALSSRLDEAGLRVWTATEARSLGRGGVSLVAKAIGMSRTTIYAGLTELASETPVTSKWNKIEHRMFCHITANWRGRPLVSREVIVNLIGNTTTNEGLRIKAALDENTCAAGIKVTDEKLATLVIERDAFHGEWNYRLKPHEPLS